MSQRHVFTLGFADQIVLSSTTGFKEFQVLGSESHPTNSWLLLGNFRADNVNRKQVFHLKQKVLVRYLKFRLLTHYGNEYFCTLTAVQAFGSTMLESFRDDIDKSTQDGDTHSTLLLRSLGLSLDDVEGPSLPLPTPAPAPGVASSTGVAPVADSIIGSIIHKESMSLNSVNVIVDSQPSSLDASAAGIAASSSATSELPIPPQHGQTQDAASVPSSSGHTAPIADASLSSATRTVSGVAANEPIADIVHSQQPSDSGTVPSSTGSQFRAETITPTSTAPASVASTSSANTATAPESVVSVETADPTASMSSSGTQPSVSTENDAVDTQCPSPLTAPQASSLHGDGAQPVPTVVHIDGLASDAATGFADSVHEAATFKNSLVPLHAVLASRGPQESIFKKMANRSKFCRADMPQYRPLIRLLSQLNRWK